ncbi:MAG TPA: ABC transporter ATP-binding protein [Thermodesulfobacteriota bacterium]|nr:ABC transporter ATP-binding protein [Thermodesulfobacteriota bacterium]
MLAFDSIDVYYGNIQALWQVSLRVEGREIVAIVGSNGAGKSTILRAVSGLIKPRRGSIHLDSRNIEALGADDIVRLGISMVPEGRELFPRMTVRENIDLGAAYIPKASGQAAATLGWVHGLFPVLRDRARQAAGTLSGGEQQMLAIARALMARPRLLMLDEPSLGLAPLMVKGVFQTVRTVNSEGVTILLVEQNVRQSLSLAHRAYVLENGRIVKEGEGRALIADPHVKEAYLGL